MFDDLIEKTGPFQIGNRALAMTAIRLSLIVLFASAFGVGAYVIDRTYSSPAMDMAELEASLSRRMAAAISFPENRTVSIADCQLTIVTV